MTRLRNAMYCALLRKSNVCCLCFEAVEITAIRIDDEVFLNENEVSEIVELSEVLAFIFGSDVGDLAISETVCKECATSTLYCYKFIKQCKENSRNLQQAIESLDNCLQNTTDAEQIQSSKSLFVSLDASYAAKEYYDCKWLRTKPSVILKRFKSVSKYTAPIVKQQAAKIKSKKETTTTQGIDPIPRDLILHKDSKPLAFKCKSCLETFKEFKTLKRHYLRFHAPKTFTCTRCERSYGSPKFLETHLKTCSRTAPIPRDLILHKDSKPSAFKCKSCLETFKEFKTLKRHYLRIHAPKTFKCSKCKRSYGSFNFLETHLKTCSGRAPIPRDLILHKDSKPSAFKCKSCLKTYKDFKVLHDHYVRVHVPKKFKCSKCECSYGCKNFLKKHLKNSHVTCVCAECGKTFNNQYSLKRHEVSHRLRFGCTRCGRDYKNRDSFRKHRESGVCEQTSRKSMLEASSVLNKIQVAETYCLREKS